MREIRIIQDKSAFIQHLGDQYCYVTSMCTIIAFYATAKQVPNIAFDMARPWFHQFSADAAKCWIF